MIRYISTFAGIGAFELAFGRLGWQCLAQIENDPFCCAVLDRWWQNVPNLGDISTVMEDQLAKLGPVDLLCGGWPCQDHSIAGKREGLNGQRSGLFYTAARLARWLRRNAGLRWLVLENVPGLFSANAGNDFAAVVSTLVGEPIHVPRSGWTNAGAACGPLGLAEWRVLDGQHWGPPQARRRIFIVVDFGDWFDRPPVLLQSEDVPGDFEAGEETGREVASTFEAYATGRRGDGLDNLQVVNTITAGYGDKRPDSTGSTPAVMTTATARYGRSPDSEMTNTVIIAENQRGEIRETDMPGAIQNAGGKPGQGHVAVKTTMGVRKLTPREVSRCFGFPDEHLEDVEWRGKKPPSDTVRYKALGNSAMPDVIEWIGRKIEEVTR